MPVVKRTLVLTGGRAGKTVLLAKTYKFVNGRMVLRGTERDVEKMTLYLGRRYAAFPEGSMELEAANGKRDLQETAQDDAKQPLQSDVQSNRPRTAEEEATERSAADEGTSGQEGLRAEGHGHENPRVSRIWEALTLLDVNDDTQWTSDGKPKVEAVEKLMNGPVTRSEIASAAPNFNRGTSRSKEA